MRKEALDAINNMWDEIDAEKLRLAEWYSALKDKENSANALDEQMRESYAERERVITNRENAQADQQREMAHRLDRIRGLQKSNEVLVKENAKLKAQIGAQKVLATD